MTEKARLRMAVAALGLATFFAFGAMYAGRPQKEPISATSFKLHTIVQITIYDSTDQAILQEAMGLIDQYEKVFSRTRTDSEIYRLNHGELPCEDGWYSLSESCAELVETGISYSELSGGAFDVSIGPVSALWDFEKEKKAPPGEEIEKARKLVDYRKIRLSGNRLRFEQEGMALDVGAVAKGYIADRVKEFLVSKGVESAIIYLGGNVLCVGEMPEGEPFKVGIQMPFAERFQTALTLQVEDRSVVSSGIYERYFEEDGVLYHHLLDPKSGYPYDSRLAAVAIISEESVDGDALSTSCFALGLEEGMELVNDRTDAQAIFITLDGELIFSDNFDESMILQVEERASRE